MMCKKLLFVFIVSALLAVSGCVTQEHKPATLPDGFVYTTDVVPNVLLDMRYYSAYNFVGQRIDGYHAPVSIYTQRKHDHGRLCSTSLQPFPRQCG